MVSYSGTPPLVNRGDFNADGEIDSKDWAIFRTNQHTDLSGLAPLEAYLRGDMDGDLANNYADFVLFKEAFESAQGVGSFASMLARVPESDTITLAMVAAFVGVTILGRAQTNHSR